MPARNPDLHGNTPDQCHVALILIDVINDLEFPGGDDLLPFAGRMAKKIARLKRRAADLGIPSIYVNDNFGRWRSDANMLARHCLDFSVRGREITRQLLPGSRDYFVLKPKNSAFFSTTLDTLLRYLRAETLVLTGIAANNCVLFTANDAYMRDFKLFVPRDCVASIRERETRHALRQMSQLLKADTRPSTKLDLQALLIGTPLPVDAPAPT